MGSFSDYVLRDGAASCVGYYRLNDASAANGAQAADSSGNARHGVFKGASNVLAEDWQSPVAGETSGVNVATGPGGVSLYSGGNNLISNALHGAADISVLIAFCKVANAFNGKILSLWHDDTGTPVEGLAIQQGTGTPTLWTITARSQATDGPQTITFQFTPDVYNWYLLGVNVDFAGAAMGAYLYGPTGNVADWANTFGGLQATETAGSKTFGSSSFVYSAPAAEGDAVTGGADRINWFAAHEGFVAEVSFHRRSQAQAEFRSAYDLMRRQWLRERFNPRRVAGYYSVRHLGI